MLYELIIFFFIRVSEDDPSYGWPQPWAGYQIIKENSIDNSIQLASGLVQDPGACAGHQPTLSRLPDATREHVSGSRSSRSRGQLCYFLLQMGSFLFSCRWGGGSSSSQFFGWPNDNPIHSHQQVQVHLILSFWLCWVTSVCFCQTGTALLLLQKKKNQNRKLPSEVNN